MNHLNNLIDAHAERAKAEIELMTQRELDALHVKIGWINRSVAQVRRYRKAKENHNDRHKG